MKYILLVFLYSLTTNVLAKNYLDENLHKLKWNDIEVVWLEEDQYPTYYVSVYFHAGARKDTTGKYGETELMFNELTSGTSRYSKQEILDSLEFYGASFGANVTHEYSTFTVDGLVKDMIPTMKMICHTFRHASYPEAEFKKTQRRLLTSLKNMVTNHSALASRIYREVELGSTSYSHPVSGTVKSISKISASDLHKKLLFYTNDVKKKIYIKGPKSIKALENIFTKDCGWSGSDYVDDLPVVANLPEENNSIYLVTVPKANQAQIRIGRYLTKGESQQQNEVMSLASKYMGGGFTSRLMQELRVKRGLTYSAGAYASPQKTYGRAGISTFTKNETIDETLKVIKQVIEDEAKNIEEANFQHIKRFIKGNYLFGLESTKAFLETLLIFDHIGKDYEEIYEFPQRIDQITKSQLQKMIHQLYHWDIQTKLVLGDVSLKKILEKNGYKVKVLKYNDFL